jgi:hypothetical protein
MAAVVNHLLRYTILIVMVCPWLAGQAPPRTEPADASCTIMRPGFKVPCPSNWSLLDEEDGSTVIANFARTPGNQKRRSGPGMATITVFSIPNGYETLGRWIRIGRASNPDAIETKLAVVNRAEGRVHVLCMTPRESVLMTGTSCFFQIGHTPAAIQILHRAEDPKKDEYRAAAQWMIEHAVPVH